VFRRRQVDAARGAGSPRRSSPVTALPCHGSTAQWPEIYATDPERRHDFDAALAEYDRLSRVYPALGYEVIVLPKVGVSERADFVLRALGE
jgi:hypothetical protein